MRVVLCKQCFAWMVCGELLDSGKEFFVHSRENKSRQDGNAPSTKNKIPSSDLRQRVMEKLQETGGSSEGDSSNNTSSSSSRNSGADGVFDWTSSFYLKLDLIPQSHISTRLASKVRLHLCLSFSVPVPVSIFASVSDSFSVLTLTS
jgi:hypothetical protein